MENIRLQPAFGAVAMRSVQANVKQASHSPQPDANPYATHSLEKSRRVRLTPPARAFIRGGTGATWAPTGSDPDQVHGAAGGLRAKAELKSRCGSFLSFAP